MAGAFLKSVNTVSTLLVLFVASLAFLPLVCESKINPYNVLNVPKRATTQEIRKSYKNLAKEWHPDKNSDPKAQDKFVEINAAYELLSDAERRQKYDTHGITDDQPQHRHHPENSGHRRFHSPFDFFEDDFFSHGQQQRGGAGGSSEQRLYHKQSVTSHQYYNTVLPESAEKPYLILFFSDWCFTCLRIEPIWAKLTEELEPVGFGIITIHAGRERELARKIGSNELPHMGLLFDGRIVHYKDPQFSALRSLEFVRSKLPYKLVEAIDDSNIDQFLNGWHDNRIRVLLFGKTAVIRLRYLATAFKFRKRAKLGYVQVTDYKTSTTLKKFNVVKSADTMLVFHEDPKVPVASVVMQDLALKTLFEVIESHRFLTLPRLSNQGIMDQLCPPASSKIRKKLCVVLVNAGKDLLITEEEQKRSALRTFIGQNDFSPDRVRFAYILKDIQSQFVNAITEGGRQSGGQDLNLAFIWRKEAKILKYEWFGQVWTASEDEMMANKSNTELKATLQRLLSPNEILSHEAVFQELLDEHVASFPMRIINKILESYEWIKDNMSKEEVLPAVSLVAAIIFVILGSQCMQWLASFDDEDSGGSGGNQRSPKTGASSLELKIHEFKAESYNGLVRLLRPGCRTIVLIVDKTTKDNLVPKFFRMAWPYRRNKTLTFAYMFIEKGLPWFHNILKQTSEKEEKHEINPKNVKGTILALNGHRKYFCMFHAKHPEGKRSKLIERNAGSFMGFESDSDSEQERDLAKVNLRKRPVPNADNYDDNLLDGFPLWLDRLFEGSTQRYYINYWPEFPALDSNLGARHHMHAE